MTEHDTDHRMRELLDEAVSDVEPGPGLDAIRQRTAARPRRSWLVAGGAALAVAAAVTAIAVLPGALSPEPGRTDTAGDGQGGAEFGWTALDPRLRAYFVGDTGVGPRLYSERLASDDPASALTGALEIALRGDAEDPDYRSPWPEGTSLAHAEAQADQVVIDLSGPVTERPAGLDQAEAALALQQLVYTAHSAVGEQRPVTFVVDGQPAATVLGEQTDVPLDAVAPDDALAPVSIESPYEGQAVSGAVTVSGRAATFEANVQWELRQGDEVVRKGFTTARECCTLSPYSFEVEAPPGDYTLVVFEEDVSDGEGFPPAQDTKDVTVE